MEARMTGPRAPRRLTARGDISTTAAAPSEIGEHMSSVSGSTIARLASTSSTVSSAPYWARGLRAPLCWFLIVTSAKSRAVAPEMRM